MVNLPFSAYLLADRMSLLSYERDGKVITSNEIVRHLFILKREQDTFKPDYCLTADFSKEKEEINYDKGAPLCVYLLKTLQYLAKRYLLFQCGQLYVKEEVFDEWMEFVRIFPPLMVEVAYFIDDFRLKGDDSQIFNKYLAPTFGNTAIRRPNNNNLEKYVRKEGGLSDLHVHMNGASETDMVWWSQIGNSEMWIRKFFPAWENEEVKRQHEQLMDSSTEETKRRIRKAKELLRQIINEMLNITDGYLLFKSVSEFLQTNSEASPILAKGAYFYWKFFNLMLEGRISDKTTRKFHEMALIMGVVHQMMVQQWWQKGFSQFQLITINDLRSSHEERNFQERFMQLCLDNNLPLIKHIEVRFSPSAKLTDNITKVSKIVRGIEKLKGHWRDSKSMNLELSLIAHFIKKEERLHSGYCRHFALRREIMQKARCLWKLNKYLFAKKLNPVVGIDAAANEMHAGPEVFSPGFRLLRGLMRVKENKDLHFTYHAGEDFRHLLSGLRTMVEAVDFLEMEQGDRLGHCTAAGIDPMLWVERMGGIAKLSKGEWLDNLLMVYDLLYTQNGTNIYPELAHLLPQLHAEIENLHIEIYGESCSVLDMIKAWKYRKYDPDIYLRGKSNYYYPFLNECCSDIHEKAHCTKAEDIYWRYHFDGKVREQYDEIVEIQLNNNIFNTEQLKLIQNLVLTKIARKKIAIEVLFTSNLAISFYVAPEEHHLKRWLTKDLTGKLMIPPLVLGSDDPGIFMTNIYIEYSRVMKYLESYGYDFRERMRILNDFTQASKFYSFSS